MKTLIVHPYSKEKLAALKVLMRELKIPFEIKKSTYDPEFVAMIKQGDKDLKEGKGIKVNLNTIFS